MNDRTKRGLSAFIRYGVCVAAITWIVTQIDRDKLSDVVTTVDLHRMALAFLAFAPVPVFISLRLKVLLGVQSIRLSMWETLKVTFAGNFLTFALPFGTGGGDSVKAYYVARQTQRKHEAVTTVFFDRVVGVIGLLGLAGIVCLANWRYPAFRDVGRIVGIFTLVLVLGSCVFFSYRLRKLFRLDRILAALPLSGHIQRIDRAVFAFRHRPGPLLGCLALTVVLQFVSVVSTFLAGWSLGLVGDNTAEAFIVYLGYTPICFLAGVLPPGVMEELSNQLFAQAADLGVAEAAYVLGFAIRIIQLTWYLPGLMVVLRAGRPRDTAIDLQTVKSDKAEAGNDKPGAMPGT